MNDFEAMKLILSTNFIQVDGPKSNLREFEYVVNYGDDKYEIETKYAIFVFQDNELKEIRQND